MFDNVAFNVVVGMVFIYLLYSLLITILGEMISSWLSLRAKVLRRALERMLNDEYNNSPHKIEIKKIWKYIGDFFLRKRKEFENSFAGRFYQAPSVKYASEGVKKIIAPFRSGKPSYITKDNFAQTLLHMFRDKGNGDTDSERIDFCLKFNTLHIQPQTLLYLKNLFTDANGDTNIFLQNLKTWYEETMDRTIGWYKRKLKLILFLLGFAVAVSFNVDSIKISRLLAKDTEAREQLVNMSIAAARDSAAFNTYVNSNGDSVRTIELLDSSYNNIMSDIREANSVLGLGWDFSSILQSDSLLTGVSVFIRDTILNQIIELNDSMASVNKATLTYINLPDSLDLLLSSYEKQRQKYLDILNDTLETDFLTISRFTPAEGDSLWIYGNVEPAAAEKLLFILSSALPWKEGFWGFLLTALMLSLGAPFWFDLLNKLVSLRGTGVKPEEKKDSGTGITKYSVIDTERIKSKTSFSKETPVETAIRIYGDDIKKEQGVLKITRGYLRDAEDKLIKCLQINVEDEETAIRIRSKYNQLYIDANTTIPVLVYATGKPRLLVSGPGEFKIPDLAIANKSKIHGWGSIGYFLDKTIDDKMYVLSCFHVLNGGYTWKKITGPKEIITFRNGSEIAISDDYKIIPEMDIAYAPIKEEIANLFINYSNPGNIRQVKTDDVRKTIINMRGGVSDVCQGVIIDDSQDEAFKYNIGNGAVSKLLKDLIVIANPETQEGPISQRGDSGSLIYENNNALGFVVAADYKFTYAVKLTNILNVLTNKKGYVS